MISGWVEGLYLTIMPKPIDLKPLDTYQIFVRYDDGAEGIVDLSDIAGSGVFSLWNDYDAFRKVRIGPFGELSWSDDVELCSDAIYLKLTGKTAEDLFQNLSELRQHAGN